MQNYRIINLESLEWKQWHPQFEGTFAKTLYVDSDTGANLRQAFLPAGFKLNELKRHHHGNTHEGVFVLFGNVRYLEYASPSVHEGKEQNFKEGFLLDRPPTSIHGPKINQITDLGCLILEWGSGPLEFNYIPFEKNYSEFKEKDFNHPIVVNSNTTPWEHHPELEGVKIKPLSSGLNKQIDAYHPMNLIYIPPGWNNPKNNYILNGSKHRKWLYVLHGDLPITINSSEKSNLINDHLKQNYYFEWFKPIEISFNQNISSEIGCVMLCIGHNFT